MARPLHKLGVFLLIAALCAPASTEVAAAEDAKAVFKQMSFLSPEEAVKTLVNAIRQTDAEAIMRILGSDAASILESEDIELYRANRDRFLRAFEKAHTLVKSSETKIILEVGNNGWQFPIPIVKNESDGWYFDMEAGKEEIENRHIGRNELSTIQAILAYVDAQREYYLANPMRNNVPSYADKFQSSPNMRDGLYYPVNEGEKPSPLGELIASAQASGRLKDKDEATGRRAFYGYFYRILKGQGPEAAGGAYDYEVRGTMFGGHALIAWPENYNKSGIKTFIVNHDGVVYEKDFGPDTATAVHEIMLFNPDGTWKIVKEDKAWKPVMDELDPKDLKDRD